MLPEERAIRLRKASMQLSKVTKTYARVLGIVDAIAAKVDLERTHDKPVEFVMDLSCPHRKTMPLPTLCQVSAICREFNAVA